MNKQFIFPNFTYDITTPRLAFLGILGTLVVYIHPSSNTDELLSA